MKRIFLSAVLSALATAACTHNMASTDSVRVLSASNELRQVVADGNAITSLNKAWAEKRQVVLKRRPEFDYRVELGAGSPNTWLYSSDGYAVLASEPYGTIYQLADRDAVNQLLGINR
ncbi:hypothetical protein HPT27_07855 [Permianibacter sp. IMCC34836]|uniref:hypothetical protein n=1 Tax=Permianibacter fluminis TaxID=2738515 RepID=UPI0015570D5E|nr:hypothetical protein [Permianibacter fluminis]NQD36937.1 hypothetical protein [Permianibacter fluminis]